MMYHHRTCSVYLLLKQPPECLDMYLTVTVKVPFGDTRPKAKQSPHAHLSHLWGRREAALPDSGLTASGLGASGFRGFGFGV